jgi:hypothetical protein
MSTIDLQAATRDLELDQGTSYDIQFNVKKDNVPLDITGYDIRCQVRKTYASSDVLINMTLQNGKMTFVDAVSGAFMMTFVPTDTSYAGNPKIVFSRDEPDVLSCVYDIELISPSSVVYKPVKGAIIIYRESTR